MSFGFPLRALVLALICLIAACARQFEGVPPPTPNLLGTYVGTWGNQPTTLVIQSSGAAPPASGLFIGSISVGGMPQMEVAGTISHPSPQGPLESTFTARVGYVEGKLILVLSLPTLSSMTPSGSPRGGGRGASGASAEQRLPEGPKGLIRLVRQPAASSVVSSRDASCRHQISEASAAHLLLRLARRGRDDHDDDQRGEAEHQREEQIEVPVVKPSRPEPVQQGAGGDEANRSERRPHGAWRAGRAASGRRGPGRAGRRRRCP